MQTNAVQEFMKKSRQFYTVKEFAALLKTHPQTIYEDIRVGRVNAFRVGAGKRSHWRIPSSEISRMALFDLNEVVDGLVKQKQRA